MAKKDIKKCGYVDCNYPGHEVDISVQSYEYDGKRYYHKSCYELKKKKEEKTEQQKADLQYIKNLWVQHISNTVNYGQLFFILNDFIIRGISSEYLIFVVKYAIDNKLNLRYPMGLKYYVDREEIKDAYEKSKRKNVRQSDFSAKTDGNDTAPEFTINKKESGFQSVFGGK